MIFPYTLATESHGSTLPWYTSRHVAHRSLSSTATWWPHVVTAVALCAVAQSKMATGVLHRVSSGLARAKSRAQSAGRLVLWSRLGRYQAAHLAVACVVFVVRCCVVFISVYVSDREWLRWSMGKLARSVLTSQRLSAAVKKPHFLNQSCCGRCKIEAVCTCCWRWKNKTFSHLLCVSIWMFKVNLVL